MEDPPKKRLRAKQPHQSPLGTLSPPAEPVLASWPCSQANTPWHGWVWLSAHLPGHGGPVEACQQKQFCTGSHCGSQLAGSRSSAFPKASLSPAEGPLWSRRKNGGGQAGCPGGVWSQSCFLSSLPAPQDLSVRLCPQAGMSHRSQGPALVCPFQEASLTPKPTPHSLLET